MFRYLKQDDKWAECRIDNKKDWKEIIGNGTLTIQSEGSQGPDGSESFQITFTSDSSTSKDKSHYVLSNGTRANLTHRFFLSVFKVESLLNEEYK